jgi:hypothetical protein
MANWEMANLHCVLPFFTSGKDSRWIVTHKAAARSR